MLYWRIAESSRFQIKRARIYWGFRRSTSYSSTIRLKIFGEGVYLLSWTSNCALETATPRAKVPIFGSHIRILMERWIKHDTAHAAAVTNFTSDM
jgi:hypothetical protein